MKTASFAMIAVVGLTTVQPVTALGMVSNKDAIIPEDVLEVIGKDQTIIAYQSMGGSGGRGETIALVSRIQTSGPVSSDSDPQWDAQFSCALVILQRHNGKASVAGRSAGAVNCEGNFANRRAKFRDLDDNLELLPGKVTFVNYSNTGPGGWYSYTFSLNGEKWLVTSGKAVYHFNETDVEGNLILSIEEASSPEDFKAVPMEDLNPEWMADLLSRHRTKVKA